MRILIADDERIARSRLARMLEPIEGVEVVGEASSGPEALRLMEELAPDLVLLDIDMPGLDGLAVAEQAGGHATSAIVFTTAHKEYALEAFEADAYDYLLKPIGRERLARAIAKVQRRLSAAPLPPAPDGEGWRLIVADGSLKRFVDAREVECFLADQKYVSFRWREAELLIRESLDALEERLVPYGFVRANRGALVQKSAVEAWDGADGGTLILRSGERVPVSRRAGPAVRAALGLP